MTALLPGLMAGAVVAACCVSCGSSSQPPTSIDCAAIIDSTDEVPEGFEATVLEVVKFPTYELDAGVRRGSEGSDVERFTFSKFGLVIHAETDVVIEVEDAGGAEVALDWATTGAPRGW